MLEDSEILTIRNERQKIASMIVGDASQLKDKVQAIYDFIEKFGQVPQLNEFDRKRIRRAADLGKQFCETHSDEVIVNRSGGLTDSRYQGIEIEVGEGNQPVKTLNSPGKSKEMNWDYKVFSIEWSAFRPIKIRLTASTRYYVKNGELVPIASLRDQSPIALRTFNGKKTFANVDPDWIDEVNGPFVECEVRGIASDDWQAVSDYLFPGDAW